MRNESTLNGVNDGFTKTAAAREVEPLVTVVIPTFNRAGLLARAIQSVLDQTYGNLEIIVVDDASSDNTQRAVREFKDHRIRYVRHESSRGGSAARNTGVRLAKGEFIGFLDDDDEWEVNKTEVQVGALERYDAVLCTTNLPQGGLLRHRGRTTVTLEDLRRGEFTSGGTGVLMARTAVLKEIPFDESLPRYQDWDLFIRIAHVCQLGYVNQALVRYNVGEHHRITNSILDMPASTLEQRLQMVRKHEAFFGPTWFRRHMCRALLYGIKRRSGKMEHLLYVARRYGLITLGWALRRRIGQKLREEGFARRLDLSRKKI